MFLRYWEQIIITTIVLTIVRYKYFLMKQIIINLQNGDSPVVLCIVGSSFKECEANHGDSGDYGEGGDPSQHNSDDPSEAHHNLEQ